MLCRDCGYRLWNLPSRQCPECGTSFVPSEYKFAPNSVRFCCPHCMQAYYGTDENGHLVPRAFPCASCHRQIDMDETLLLPAEGVDEGQTGGQEMPWLRKGQVGFGRRWLGTIGWALVRPQQLMRLMPAREADNSGWLFALFTVFMTTLAVILPFQLFFLIGGMGGGVTAAVGFVATICGAVVVVPIIAAVVFLVWAAITHAMLRVTGGAAYPLERTCQAICFSYGANVFSAIPCIGLYFGWIWWVVSAVLMLKEGQKVGGWRATVATLTAPGLVLGFSIGFLVWGIASGGIINPFGVTTVTTILVSEASTVANALTTDARQRSGKPAAHAIELLVRDWLIADNFISSNSMTVVDDIPVTAGKSLQDFELLSDTRCKEIAREMIEALPVETVAHRFGDFVFTHHGMDFSKPGPKLWVVIGSPDPDVNGSPNPTDWVVMASADSTSTTTIAIQVQQFPSALLAQNAARAAQGLPPLKDPLGVTHAKPEVTPLPQPP